MAGASDAEKIVELNRLLATGAHGRVIAKLPRFLKKRGITDKSQLAGEGWMKILVNMVPMEFKSIDDLLHAINDTR